MLSYVKIFENLTAGLPRFDDGRINYHDARKAPVINIVIYYQEKILIVKRSQKVGSYKGMWNGISGFIDELKPLDDFVRQEVGEELSMPYEQLTNIKIAEPYEVNDTEINRVWVVFPALVVLDLRPVIKLDWEHTD